MQHVNNVVPFAPVPMPADIAATIITDEFIAAVAGADVPADELQDGGEFVDFPPDDAPADIDPVAAAHKATDDALLATPPVVTVTTCTALVDRAELMAAVAACVRVVEKRNTIPILANVRLREADGALVVTGTDLDIEVRVPVSGGVDSGFGTTVPAHVLLDILKKAKAAEMVALDITSTVTAGYREHFAYGGGDGGRRVVAYKDGDTRNVLDFDGLRVTLQGLPTSDFPDLAAGEFSHTFTLPAADLARAFKRTQFAISTEETRYYLNGIYLHVPHGDATLRCVATDGHRLAQVDVAAPDGCAGMPGGIVPRKTVAEVLRLATAKGAPASIDVRVSQTKIEFVVGNVTVLSKLIDGTFPDYGRVVPLGNDKSAIINRDALVSGIGQVSVISSERGRAVKFSFEATKVLLSVTNPDTGSATMNVPCTFYDPLVTDASAYLDVGFNARYLCDVLGQIESDEAELLLADPGSPLLVKGAGESDAGVLFVLMPMRV